MKFVQTLYITEQTNPYNQSFGWFLPVYHFMGWALSSLQLNKLYKNVELYANTPAAKLLIDVLNLPYKKVYTNHDKFNLSHVNLWALSKIYTYSLQEKPFLHLDGDVFLFKKFNKKLLESQLIAQNPEITTEYSIAVQKELNSKFAYFPECVKKDIEKASPLNSINAGILGGYDIAFFKNFTKKAFDYVKHNEESLSSINTEHFNVYFEQHLFSALAKEKNIQINFLLPDTIKDNEYKHLDEFHKTPCIKPYLHLLSHYKKDEYTCIQMAATLRRLYPEYYYKIILLCRKKGMIYPLNYFYFNHIPSQSDFKKVSKIAKNIYLQKSLISYTKIFSSLRKTEIPILSQLKNFINFIALNPNHSFSISKLRKDFNQFSNKLVSELQKIKYGPDFFFGRDLESQNWYCKLFSDTSKIEAMLIVKSEGILIIESRFDWAGIINKTQRVGIMYYDNLEIKVGQFFNVIIPEVTNFKLSIYDIDEMEKVLLEFLSTPKTIKSVFIEMEKYIEEDVKQNHIIEYRELVLTFIKQLVIKKAITPFNN